MPRKIKLPDNINRRINRATIKVLDACAEKIANDCNDKYMSIIKDFYGGYSPHSYQRTYETFAATNFYKHKKDYKRISRIIGDDKVRILYRIDSKYIEGNPYRAEKSWVFGRTFEEGIHGWTPEEVMQYVGGHNYGYYGKEGQFYINRMLGWTDVPEPMSPPPKELIDEWAQEYKKPGNLRKLLAPIASDVFHKYF